jgi:PAS domain S-box-containing protein
MNRFPGMGRRIQQRLKTTGYWKDGRPEIARFCADKGYRPQYLYAWLGDRVPSYENLIRLARDLDVRPEWVMFGATGSERAQPSEPADGAKGPPRAQIIDFARLREVTSRLVRLEAELEAIFRAFPDFYFWLDADGTFLAWQGGRGSQLHIAPELMLGKKIADAFPPEAALALERGARDASVSGGVVSVEFALGARSYETRFLPLGDRATGPRPLLMIVREITERKQAEEAAGALARIGHELAGTLDPTEATERVVSAVLDLFRVRRASLFQLDPASGSLVCVAIAGLGDRDKWKGQVVPPGATLVQQAIREGRPVWSRDVTTDPLLVMPTWLSERVLAEGLKSVVALPLVSRGEVLGVLALAADSTREFTQADVGLLAGFADGAALALQNARLYEEARGRRREAEVVAELAGRISASLELGSVLQAVVDGARELCGGDLALIALREGPDVDACVVRYWTGPARPPLAGLRVEAGKGLGGLVLASGRSLRSDDYAADPRFSKDYLASAQSAGIVTSVVVPIRTEQRVEGLLYVHNRTARPFTDRDEAVLTRLAEHAAIAIGNARVYARSERRRRAAEALADVGRLVTQSLDPDVVAQRIADAVLTLFGARASVILRVEPVFGDLLAVAVAGEVTPGISRGLILPAGIGVSSRAVRERRPIAMADLLGDPTLEVLPAHRSALEADYRSVLAVPLLGRDGATGALVLRDRTGRRFVEEDVRLLQAFADQAALALENAQRFRDAERSRAAALAAALHTEQRFESLVRGLTAIVWEADAATWQVLFIGQAAETILGYALERWYTEPGFWLEHVHPEDRERVRARREAAPAEDHELEYRMISADGRVVWFSDFVHVIRHEDGRVRWLHGVMVDITESKLAAEATRALGEIGRLLTASRERGAVSQAVADSVQRLFGVSVAVLYQAVPDSGGVIALAGGRREPGAFDWNRFLPDGTGLLGLAMRERCAVFSPDILADPRVTYTPEVRARIERGRTRAMLAVPLIVKGAVVGALSVGDRAGRTFDEREVRLAQAFADQAALALASEPRVGAAPEAT